MVEPELRFDTTLLNGFRFSCRPDCGLCCYTTPAVTASELNRLRAVRPGLPLVTTSDGRTAIAGHPNGGACRMLTGRRCSVYAVRPGPCTTFPVSVHGGSERWQASLVLSCPGLTLDILAGWTVGAQTSPCQGLENEIEAAQQRSRLPYATRGRANDWIHRRRAERLARRQDPQGSAEKVREALRRETLQVWPQDLPGEIPPAVEDGVDYLPLVWEGPDRVVGIEGDPLGFRFVDLDPSGAREEPSEVFPLPRTILSLTPEARSLLDGYLRYWVERDALFDYVLTDMVADQPSVQLIDRIRRELSFIGATVIARAAVRARRRGEFERRLSFEAMVLGVQATDMDLLDRPSLGVRL